MEAEVEQAIRERARGCGPEPCQRGWKAAAATPESRDVRSGIWDVNEKKFQYSLRN